MLALIGIVVGVQGPVVAGQVASNAFRTTTESALQLHRQAQAYARASAHDSAWGVYSTAQEVVLFRGESYASRDATYDIAYVVPTSIFVSGDSECVFQKRTGYTASGCTSVLTHPRGHSATLATSVYGQVSIQ